MIRTDCVVRDGAALVTEVHLPTDASKPLPAVLLRTPYNRELFGPAVAMMAEHGFALVVQSVRGRYGSGGEWRPYANEGLDGYDAIEWCAEQPWCDGNVAIMGASYSGWTVWAAAVHQPPSLRTMISSVSCMSWTGEWPWRNGVLWPGAIAWLNMVRGAQDVAFSDDELNDLMRSPMTPLAGLQQRFGVDLPIADEWLKHASPDEFWSPMTLSAEDFARIDVPVLHVTGWFDGCQIGSQLAYDGMRAHSPAADKQALLIGAWDHQVAQPKREYDGVDFGAANVGDFSTMRLEWLRHWLTGEGSVDCSARIFDTGTLQWSVSESFPPAELAQMTLHLAPGGSLTDAVPDEGLDVYVYDPLDPTPCRTDGRPGAQPSLIRDGLHDRDDIVVYRSAPLSADVTLSGMPTAVLHVSSDAPDTDFFVTLGDESETGTTLVAHGMMRARFHGGLDKPQLLEPGEVYELRMELTPRLHTYRAGHRVVVEVASSGTPLWAANPNSGGDIFTEDEPRIARNTIHHGGTHASRVILPTESA